MDFRGRVVTSASSSGVGGRRRVKDWNRRSLLVAGDGVRRTVTERGAILSIVGCSGRAPRTGMQGTSYARTGTQGGSAVGPPSTLASGLSALMSHQRAMTGEHSAASLTAVPPSSVTCGLHMAPSVRSALMLREESRGKRFSLKPGRELESLSTVSALMFVFGFLGLVSPGIYSLAAIRLQRDRGAVFVKGSGFPVSPS